MKMSEKLKSARLLLNETQSVASKNSGTSQRDISYLEAGKKENIPTEYLTYLQRRGIDLNSLFDETKELETVKNNLPAQIQKLLQDLKEREEMILLMKDAIQLRNEKIEKLEVLSGKEEIVL
jgi:transcriptional regulator with XRE-family HTH domain